MNEASFYQNLLALPGLTVTQIEHHAQRITIHGRIQVEPAPCPVCGEPTGVLHKYDTRKVQDLSISGKEVWLHLRIPQLVCSSCPRYFTNSPEWIMPGKSYTRRQAKWIFLLCDKQPFTEVAALVNLSHKTVERLYYQMAEEAINLPHRYAQVRKLGIDEIAHHKGKGAYVCVLTDLERGSQLDILPDRKKDTLIAHFEAHGPDFCQQIEVVACDMWRPYHAVAAHCLPNAEVVVDRFHVVKALNHVLDRIRKRLRVQHKDQACFKGIKWTLFKRGEHLSSAEAEQLKAAFSQSWLLEEVYRLRERFHALFDVAGDQSWLEAELGHWIAHAAQLSNEYVDAFLGTLGRWLEPITAYATTGMTNAVTEGLNNYLRYFKRISFGLPKFEHMRLRILMATA